MNWNRQGSVLAWPSNWQRPNKTEEWAYERCLSTLGRNPFLEVVCFPWATLIDLQRNGHIERARDLLEALYWAPPRITLRRATVMQHIWAKDMLAHLQTLGVTDVYWSHATTEEMEWENGIRVHPFPLYPVCCGTEINPADTPASADRPYLFSFIGAYEPGLYLSDVRRWIFDLKKRPDACVIRRDEWHYQGPVYRQQINQETEEDWVKAKRQTYECEYRETLEKSIFSLCPSGSGPNSIRLWESLGLGCIPVLISDNLRLPGPASMWSKASIQCVERPEALMKLIAKLEFLSGQPDELARMRCEGEALWTSIRNFDNMGFLR